MNLVVTARTGISAREKQQLCRDLHIDTLSGVLTDRRLLSLIFYGKKYQADEKKWETPSAKLSPSHVLISPLKLKISVNQLVGVRVEPRGTRAFDFNSWYSSLQKEITKADV